MEKYYTPEIEEFHVGFEYEVQANDDSTEFEKLTIEKNKRDFEFLNRYALNNIDYDVRVKYLDKEDIESLGFVETSNNWFTIDAPGKLGYWTQVVIDFRWMHRTEPYKDISILGKRGEENDVIFRGIIKNKSELKRLLKQLNIL